MLFKMHRNIRERVKLGIVFVFVFNTVLLCEHIVIIQQEHSSDVQQRMFDYQNEFSGGYIKNNLTHHQQNDLSAYLQKSSEHHFAIRNEHVVNDRPHDTSVVKFEKPLNMDTGASVREAQRVQLDQLKAASKVKVQRHANVTFMKIPAEAVPKKEAPYQRRKYPTTTTIAPDVLAEMEKTYYRPRDTKVNEFQYGYAMKPSQNCAGDYFMLVLVHSKPDYHERRDAIRRTWASVTINNNKWGPKTIHRKIFVVFVLGLSVDPKLNDFVSMESSQHGDILVGNFTDSYKNMTLKSLLGLKYATEHCRHIPYLLKSDDDMFINVPYLTSTLAEDALERSIMGPYNGQSKVYRKGKWKLTKDEFPFPFYPPYESGSAYAITMDIVPDLYNISHYVPYIFVDDVYITGILGKILNVSHAKKPGQFAYWTDKAPKFCDILQNRKMAVTKCTPKVLDTLWSYVIHADAYRDKCTEIDEEERKQEERRLAHRKQLENIKAYRERQLPPD